MIDVNATTDVPAPAARDETAEPGEASRPLRSTLRRGTAWTLLGYGGAQGLRFAGNLVLTRLLFPEAFGLMSLVHALLVGLHLFSDFGIGPSIIQSRFGAEPRYLDTAWTVQIVRGLVLWLVACAAAVPVAEFYREPDLAWILPVTGLAAVISGFDSTRLFGLYRRVDLARIYLVEIAAQAVSMVVMIVWANLDRSVAALLAGSLVGCLIKMVLSHVALPGHRNRPAFDRESFGRLIHFGRWIFLSTLLTFLVGQSDRLIFGKLVPMAMLGVFGVGVLIASLPCEILARIGSSVLFPALSAVRNAGRELTGVFTGVRRPALVLAGWMVAGLAAGGAVAVSLLYDQRYADAGWIVQVMALGSWFSILETTNSSALLACGQAKWVAAGGAGKLAGMLVLIPLGFLLAGFPGAVVGLAVSETGRYVVSAVGVRRAGLRGWPQDLAMTSGMLATAAAGWAAASLAQRQGFAPVVAALAVLLVVSLLWMPAALACRRSTVLDS